MTHRHGPVLIDGQRSVQLERLPLNAAGRHTEAQIQSLVYGDPQLVPMGEIEPAYADMISLCIELPLAAGRLDNLWMTPRGGIVLGECKLYRNPQARREVIAQSLDYARSLQSMSYETFEAAIGAARREPHFRLWSFLTEGLLESEIVPEAAFIDGVSRRLRAAQLMILIIGDGIREELEDLTDFMQLHAGIHANLALVDLSLWRLPDGRQLVIPRVPMKTATILRGIVQIDTAVSGIQLVPGASSDLSLGQTSRSSAKPSAKTGSAQEFLTMLQESDAASAAAVGRLFDRIPDTGAEVRFTPQYGVVEIDLAGKSRTVLAIKYTGELFGGDVVKDLADGDLKERLAAALNGLAAAMGGQLSYSGQRYHRFVLAAGKRLRPADFSGQEEEVAAAIAKLAAAAMSDD